MQLGICQLPYVIGNMQPHIFKPVLFFCTFLPISAYALPFKEAVGSKIIWQGLFNQCLKYEKFTYHCPF